MNKNITISTRSIFLGAFILIGISILSFKPGQEEKKYLTISYSYEGKTFSWTVLQNGNVVEKVETKIEGNQIIYDKILNELLNKYGAQGWEFKGSDGRREMVYMEK